MLLPKAGGSLSATTATTDAEGRAVATLTLGSEPETVTIVATVAGLDPVTFTATAKATPDFDGDGEASFSDFFLFADAFGSSDPRFDLDESGTVDFADFFLLADYFADPARAKLLALAREMIGLPEGPQLQQNAPNPFNSEDRHLLVPAAGGSGARGGLRPDRAAGGGAGIRGPQKVGVHRVHWDGPKRARPPSGQRRIPVPADHPRNRSDAQAHPAAIVDRKLTDNASRKSSLF